MSAQKDELIVFRKKYLKMKNEVKEEQHTVNFPYLTCFGKL